MELDNKSEVRASVPTRELSWVERQARSCTNIRGLHPLAPYLHFAARWRNRTPSPSDMLISWARPALARIAIALRSSDSGIPESADGTGGFEIS